jgi:phosphoglycolate phosphatase
MSLNMSESRFVIFDLDGTLIDTIGDLGAAVERALEEGGFPGHTLGEYRSMVGHGIRNLVTRALPEGASEETIDASLKVFKDYYTSHIDVYSRPYPGIHGLLRSLSDDGVSIAVASNKFQEGTETLMRRFFPDIPFAAILGNAPGLPLKPDPEVVYKAIEIASQSKLNAGAPPVQGRVHSRFAAAEYGLRTVATPASQASAVKAVMVGDSATDIKTARNAGIPAIGVSWGFRPRADLEIADAVADDVDELRELIISYIYDNK